MIDTLSSPVVRLVVHDERDVFEEALQVLELLERLDQFLEVLEPPRRLGRLVVLPHRRVARLVEDALGQLDMALPPVAHGRCQRSMPSTSTRSSAPPLPPSPFDATRSRAPSCSDTPFARAVRWMSACALSPSPRLGVFTIRSKARSSSGDTASRK